MDKTRYIIGIDPDVEKSGFAVLDTQTRTFTHIEPLSISNLFLGFFNHSDEKGFIRESVVILEDSDSPTNWHLHNKMSPRVAAAIGHAAGMCHATQRHIQEIAEAFGFNVILHHPLKKIWMGHDGKITQKEISQFIPDLPKKMNQECRDACLLAWSYANFPVHMPASFYTTENLKKVGLEGFKYLTAREGEFLLKAGLKKH